jgi:hypothetical protein
VHGDVSQMDIELVVLFRFSYRCPMLWSRKALGIAVLAGMLDEAMDDLHEVSRETGVGFSLLVVAGLIA